MGTLCIYNALLLNAHPKCGLLWQIIVRLREQADGMKLKTQKQELTRTNNKEEGSTGSGKRIYHTQIRRA